MAQYQANSRNTQNFSLTLGNQKIGELIYSKWYSFKAEIVLADDTKYQLEPKGFWDSKIELKDNEKTLLDFKLGWKGIVIKSFLDNQEQTYLLKLKSLLSYKFMLIDTNNDVLMAAETHFKWNKFSYDYSIETSPVFEHFDNKELLLLTILHCINYYMTVNVSG